MKTYQALEKLIEETPSLHWDGAVFVNRKEWTASPLTASLLFLEGDDELEDLADVDAHLPRLAAERNMQQLFDVQTLQDVVKFEQERNPDANPSDFAHAMNYYLEMDDFFDPASR